MPLGPSFLKAAALSLALAVLASPAGAGLVFDIRLANGSKSAIAGFSGQVFDYDVFVQVTGTDANLANDTFQSAYAYIRSVGDVRVNITHVNAPEWSINNDSDGVRADRDGDGDFEVGGAGNLNTDPPPSPSCSPPSPSSPADGVREPPQPLAAKNRSTG